MDEKFKQYVNNFDINDYDIKLKYYHSIRVKDLCQVIAKYAGFNQEDAKIAEVVGLLHDYGRFPQWTEYHTYNDEISIDHAEFAVEQLFDNKEIVNFWGNAEDYDEIYDAIKYHNKYKIPDNLSPHNKLLCQIIRDADKLDILYLRAIGSIKFGDISGKPSEKVIDDFYNEKEIAFVDVKNQSDRLLQILAFVYDMNFKYSFEYLKKYKLIDKLYDLLKDRGDIKPYFDKINDYINRQIRKDW